MSSYLIWVSPVLVFSPVWSIAEGLCTSWKFTGVRFLARVRTQMGLQILESRIGFGAIFKLKLWKGEGMRTLFIEDWISCQEISLLCICVAFLPYVFSCEPQACTGPWKASPPANILSTGKWMTSYSPQYGHCSNAEEETRNKKKVWLKMGSELAFYFSMVITGPVQLGWGLCRCLSILFHPSSFSLSLSVCSLPTILSDVYLVERSKRSCWIYGELPER